MTETVGVRRSLLVESMVFLLCLLGVALAASILGEGAGVGGVRFWASLVVAEIFGAAWLVRALRRPWWFRLDNEGMMFSAVLGRSERLPSRAVDSHLGHVVDVRSNRRILVGESRFPGVEKLHRAIRVRRAAAGVPQGTD